MSVIVACAGVLGCKPPDDPAAVSTHVTDWRDQVIYQIVVDRFDNGDPTNDELDGVGPMAGDLARFQGGDWAGVRRRLDYIQHLGATAIWLSPPYENVDRTAGEDGYHGYWPADFTRPNLRFGDLETLQTLVQEAHARGMLVILDIVPNHAGRVFTYDLNRDGEVDLGETEPPWADPPYDVPLLWTHRPSMYSEQGTFTLEAEHFHRRGSGDLSDPIQKELGDFPTGLRDLDTERADVIQALVTTHVRWVLDTDVDGFRVDAIPHASTTFWAALCAGIRRELARHGKHRFLLLGEVFNVDPGTLARYTRLDQLDSAFAFDLKGELIDGVILAGGAPSEALGSLGANRRFFPGSPQPNGVELDPWRARVAFADNHDVWRLRGELDDPFAAQVALVVVFTVDAIPSIYYGTEQDLDGRSHHEAREPLFLESTFDETGSTYRFIAQLASIRARSRALRYGDLRVRYASTSGGADPEPASDAGMLAYERTDADERVLIVLNASLDTSSAAIQTGFAEGEWLFDALGAANAPWRVEAGGMVTIRLPGRSAVVLEARR